ncbi:hypothetical protein BX616_004380 [Lobosporangium transversale]|uniref:Uncharacterized protein n=1 Tax=Lobosporangium transversale TaxID=64571 RepID=A0A1Y2GRZ0_9FUNG|nr:hypothetical protein BCR41DRAFT_395496 [Lobosporangium transversale]KAF9898178.1 hypothetical protein BX616_004380 [Lobosporangium transversale]ORZ18255.1 hypothetical protein BCR41DRAFT_395496 [Lobosporangium transversale]|eukprot:XP_021882050.1 hypothetical protein BCR41DRAFT_395496 [Lobosporangium transversale]
MNNQKDTAGSSEPAKGDGKKRRLEYDDESENAEVTAGRKAPKRARRKAPQALTTVYMTRSRAHRLAAEAEREVNVARARNQQLEAVSRGPLNEVRPGSASVRLTQSRARGPAPLVPAPGPRPRSGSGVVIQGTGASSENKSGSSDKQSQGQKSRQVGHGSCKPSTLSQKKSRRDKDDGDKENRPPKYFTHANMLSAH